MTKYDDAGDILEFYATGRWKTELPRNLMTPTKALLDERIAGLRRMPEQPISIADTSTLRHLYSAANREQYQVVGWPDAPPVRMATNARFVKLPADKAKQALGPAIGEHLGQSLPEGTEITHIGVQGGDVIVEFRHPDFGELPPCVSQELKPREKKS